MARIAGIDLPKEKRGEIFDRNGNLLAASITASSLAANPLKIKEVTQIGLTPANQRQEETTSRIDGNNVYIKVGDSRRGWVDSYELLLELCSDESFFGRDIEDI